MKLLLKNTAFVFGFLALLFSSWVFIHILALLGIFLVFLYPLWWLLLPKYNLCLLCRIRKEGMWCPLCKQKVTHGYGQHSPVFLSALLNSGIILVFSLLAMGVVFLESIALIHSGWVSPPATVSFVIPTKGQYGVGEVFPMKLEIGGIKVPINVVQADISYDPARLEVVDISTNGSFATIFVQKEINNIAGYARLTGGIPNPGFAKSSGLFGTVYFKGKSPGPVSVKFLPTTMALANDGKGTNVLRQLGDIPYIIVSADVSRAKLNKPTKVLGITTDDETKMFFYDDENNNVLAADTSAMKEKSQQEKGQNSFSVVRLMVNWLSAIDTFIVNVWVRFLLK